jgi:Clp amino terminal domain, pathogenicity island component
VFERFNEHGRQVIVLATDEARSLGHGQIGSEHLLLGLLREDDDLVSLLGDPADLRARVVEILGFGDAESSGQMPFTRHARDVLVGAASGSESSQVGPLELALALLALPIDATALRALRLHGVAPADARAEILALLTGSALVADDPGGLDAVARRVLDTAARHADDGQPGPEHLLLALVLEAPELTGRALGVRDGGVVHERLVGLLDGPELGLLAPRRDIAVIEAALRDAAREERDVTAADLLLGLIEVAPDVVARAAVDLEQVAWLVRRSA